ncbi:MAG TPA: histidine--tRNA ligase [Anaerolineaceae bacterium]|nr:histidine--tRNA ligase [Anaerolineaceae bacterium]
MKNIIQGVRGARDFYPQQMKLRRWLYKLIEEVSVSFGYEEYDGPFIEKIDLYAAKSGEELVKEQAFVFADRGGDLVTLRPELTPSLARMVALKQNELVFPIRWWSFGPFWRYEKPQKGRAREFFQWNIDLIGIDSAEADAELLAICATFLKRAGITPEQITIKVNHRKFMEAQLVQAGIPLTLKKSVFQLIDRIDKLSRTDWIEHGRQIGLDEEQLDRLLKIFDDENLWRESKELSKIFEVLQVMNLDNYVSFDARIIRGLDYYTGTVFEAWDIGGDGRAVLGGGHYDNLVADVGGTPLPGVGFAMGDVMITLLLDKYGCIPEISQFKENILVTVFDQDCTLASNALASRLRDENLSVTCYQEVSKLQKQFKFADRQGIRFVLVLGPDEMEAGKVTIKDLEQHSQVTVSQEVAGATIKGLLAAQ